MPAIVDDSLVIADSWGAVFRVALEDQREIWVSPNATCIHNIFNTQGMLPYGTTATSIVGPNDKI